MNELKHILESAVKQPVPEELCTAIAKGTLVLIDGDRSSATGKSHLCERLREMGVAAHEKWEIEEGLLDLPADTNGVYVGIWLGESLT